MSWTLTRGTGKFSTLPTLTIIQNGNLFDFIWGGEFKLERLPLNGDGGNEQCAGKRYVGGNWVDVGRYEVTYTVERKEGNATLKVMDGASELIRPLGSVEDGTDDPLSGTWGAEGPGIPLLDPREDGGSTRSA